jgi:hypothetical protein
MVGRMAERLTDEDIARLKAEGEACRKEAERRTAPMRLSPPDLEWARAVAERVRLEARIAELEAENARMRAYLEAQDHDFSVCAIYYEKPPATCTCDLGKALPSRMNE